MVNRVLLDHQRWKQDNSNDEIFYSTPKLVHHLDAGFRDRLTKLYTELIPKNSIILDLMSSWVSHLPKNIKYKKIIGHGLNEVELKSNPRLDSYWVQNLNINQSLLLDQSCIDICTIVAGWQYLQEPEAIACELKRIIKPGGLLIISFSNRAFWHKAPSIWIDSTSEQRLNYISAILVSQGWPPPDTIKEETISKNIFNILKTPGDPFYSIVAKNK